MAKSSGSRYRLLLTLLLLAIGCYHGPYRGVLGGGIDTIAIPFVGNQTAEYAAADSLIRATVVAFREDGQLRLADEGGADAILYLDILSVDDRVHTRGRVLGQYQFSMVVSVEIKSFEGAVLLRQYESIGRGTYDDDERDKAVGKAVRMVVRELIDRVGGGC